VGSAKRRRERTWRECRHHAVGPGNTRTHRDQREHVEVARLNRSPAPLEERPACPQHHRRRQQHLHPVRHLRADQAVEPDQVPTHFECDNRQAQYEADDETPFHVGIFRRWAIRERRRQRFERHAADRATTGTRPLDLRVHRAGPDRALRHVLRWSRSVGSVARRVSFELRTAPCATEVVMRTAMRRNVRRCRGIDAHPADGIGYRPGF
jgi:hypothetical protein